MKFYFITFCHNKSFEKYSITMKLVKQIYPDSICYMYTAEDLPKEINDYADLYPRGYGYYLWKPYIILQKLNEISDNDIILYADSRCHIKGKCNWLEDLIQNIEYDIAHTSTFYPECYFTRKDLFSELNKIYNIDNNDIDKILNSHQHMATFMAIRKNNKTIDFIKNWYIFMNNNKQLINDLNKKELEIERKSVSYNNYFRENRHDQSVFSVLIKIYNKYNLLNIRYIENKDIPQGNLIAHCSGRGSQLPFCKNCWKNIKYCNCDK